MEDQKNDKQEKDCPLCDVSEETLRKLKEAADKKNKQENND